MAGGVSAAPDGGAAIAASAAGMFQAADRDGNGFLTKEDFINYVAQSQSQPAQNFPAPDGVQTEPLSPGAGSAQYQSANGKQVVYQQPYAVGPSGTQPLGSQSFVTVQPNGLPVGSQPEMEPPVLPVFTQGEASNNWYSNGGPPQQQSVDGSTAEAAAMVFAAMDRNNDGVVTKEEFQQFVADAASGNTAGVSAYAPLLACTGSAGSGTPLLQLTSPSMRGSVPGTVPTLVPVMSARSPTTVASRPLAAYQMAPVQAQAPATVPRTSDNIFAALDQNHDGVITEAELAQALYRGQADPLLPSFNAATAPPVQRYMEPPQVIPPPVSSRQRGGMLELSRDHPGGDLFAPFKDEVGMPDLVFSSSPQQAPAQAAPAQVLAPRGVSVNSSPAMLPPMHLSSAEVKYSYSQPVAPPASAPHQHALSVHAEEVPRLPWGRGLLHAGSEHPGGDLFTIFGGGEVDLPGHPLDFSMGQVARVPEELVTVELLPVPGASSRTGLLANASEHPGGDLFTSFARERAPRTETYTFIKTTPPNVLQSAPATGFGFAHVDTPQPVYRSSPVPVVAAPSSPVPVVQANDLFNQLDRNHDGVITRDEIQAALEGQAAHPVLVHPQEARTVPTMWHHSSTQPANQSFTFRWN